MAFGVVAVVVEDVAAGDIVCGNTWYWCTILQKVLDDLEIQKKDLEVQYLGKYN